MALVEAFNKKVGKQFFKSMDIIDGCNQIIGKI